uniref:Uncharacterized protein n=1 Tax=Oryza meridionalis TaxID=40149 RepID=A0A0E0D880_9ORYZ
MTHFQDVTSMPECRICWDLAWMGCRFWCIKYGTKVPAGAGPGGGMGCSQLAAIDPCLDAAFAGTLDGLPVSLYSVYTVWSC